MITVTESAVKQLKTILEDEAGAGDRGLRIFVEHGGCAGLQYGMALDMRKDGDVVVGCDGAQIFVDEESARYLAGSTVDFADGLSGAGFRIQNPNAVRSCGCGTSFETAETDAHAHS